MARRLTVIDFLRIERFVWTLDMRLYDLPGSSRIARRREVRTNLIAAAKDVGTGEALRRLGRGQQLAEEYLAAELGDRPRHSWLAAAYFAGLFPLLLIGFFGEAGVAFEHGVTAANPHATGTFVSSGVSYLQEPLTYTFADGQASHVGGSFTLLTYALWIVGSFAAGRLWRPLQKRVAGRRES